MMPRPSGRVARLGLGAARAVTHGLLRLPSPILSALAGAPPPTLDGQRLDPAMHIAIAARRRLGLRALETLTPERARPEFERQLALVDLPPAPVARVEAVEVPGPAGPLPARLYVPEGAPSPGPAIVWLHGGGWVVGSLDSHDAPCRHLARASGVRVLSVAYRLAPEARFPAACDDALAAWRWVAEDPTRIGAAPGRLAVGGDSAGGNLSAGVCLAARDGAAPLPTLQLLVYPSMDLTCAMPSHRTFAEGFLLSARLIAWFIDLYLPGADDARDPRASPWFAPDVSGLPPAHVVTAGFDPLRDEGRRWADRLRDAGVPVSYRNHDALPHGFVSFGGASRAARDAWAECAAVLRRAL